MSNFKEKKHSNSLLKRFQRRTEINQKLISDLELKATIFQLKKGILVHTLGIIYKVLKTEQESLERDKNKFEVSTSQVSQILLGFTASLPAPKGLSTK